VPKQPATGAAIPRPLLAAVLATAVEALVLAASTLGLPLHVLLGHRPHDSLDLWMVVALAAIGAAGLVLITRGLYLGRRWARAPAVLTQLLVVPVSWNTLRNGAAWAGVPLLLCGLVGLVGLFAPSTGERLDG
jgi:hypothetical protein